MGETAQVRGDFGELLRRRFKVFDDFGVIRPAARRLCFCLII
jgi:hypothetical protein